MRALLLLSSLVVTLCLAGCGSPVAGDSCSQNGFLCQDELTALECRAGLWTMLPCRGPNGCKRVEDNITCDMSQNIAGDYCASTSNGKGLCTASGTATIECKAGVFVQTNTCRTCAVSGEQVICTQ